MVDRHLMGSFADRHTVPRVCTCTKKTYMAASYSLNVSIVWKVALHARNNNGMILTYILGTSGKKDST